MLSIENGMVMQNSALGSVASYDCDLGYTLQGNSTRTCQADSRWTGTDPGCEGITVK